MLKKNKFLLILKDRIAVMLLIGIIVGSIVLVVISVVKLQVSDVQVPIRYSGYGLTNIYRDKWYALLAFTGFGAITLLLNCFLGIKIYSHSRFLSIWFMTLSLIVVII